MKRTFILRIIWQNRGHYDNLCDKISMLNCFVHLLVKLIFLRQLEPYYRHTDLDWNSLSLKLNFYW